MDTMMRTVRYAWAAMLVLLLPGTTVCAQSLDEPITEYELKAAFLYNFAAYVTWPPAMAEPTTPLVIGVVGARELADYLEDMAEVRQINDRDVLVRRIRSREDFADLHMVFVSERAIEDVRNILVQALNSSTLTVTESRPRERLPTSVINFQVINDRVRFDVSLQAARTAGLTVSSRLLQVAVQVIGNEP